MPETAPNPPPSAPGIPPVDPNALVATALAVLKTPADFFRSIKDEKGFQKPLTFSVAVWAVYAVLRLLYPLFHLHIGSVIGVLVVAAIFAFVWPFVGGIILWAICMAFGSKATWERAVPIVAYSSVVVVASGIASLLLILTYAMAPLVMLVGLAAAIYGIYLCYVGAKALMFEPTPEVKPAP